MCLVWATGFIPCRAGESLALALVTSGDTFSVGQELTLRCPKCQHCHSWKSALAGLDIVGQVLGHTPDGCELDGISISYPKTIKCI